MRWIDADHFAAANEGDMDGGSRVVSIWHKDEFNTITLPARA